MSTKSIFLRGTLYGLFFIGVQACTQDMPTPSATSTSSSNATALAKGNADKDRIKVRRVKYPVASGDSSSVSSESKTVGPIPSTSLKNQSSVPRTNLIMCYDNWDIYYNLYTGEIISQEYVGRSCVAGNTGSGDSGSGGTGGGGSGGDGGAGSGAGGYTFTSTPTDATAEPDFPSDCGSWKFQAVGPSGYLACGVTGIEIDLLSQYQRADGTHGIGYNIYHANLYFEMPPRYSPGQAATACAEIKDEVEE